MFCLHPTINVQHNKNCLVLDNYTASMFIIEVPKFHNSLGKNLSVSLVFYYLNNILYTIKFISSRTSGFLIFFIVLFLKLLFGTIKNVKM